MSKTDWCRHRTWELGDQEEFFARLKRSRDPAHKAQYTRIQAFELQQTRDPNLTHAAIGLIEMILKEWPNCWELALVCDQLGQCFSQLGQHKEALKAFSDALDAQRKRPLLRTHAHLEFGWICIAMPKPDAFDKALNLLDEFVDNPVFPVEIYQENAIRAVIQDFYGNKDQARRFARTAILASRQTHSGMRYHPEVGLVKSMDPKIHQRLQALANN